MKTRLRLSIAVVVLLSCTWMGDNAFAKVNGENDGPLICEGGFYGPLTCGGDYNICFNTAQAQLAQSSSVLSSLNLEQGNIQSKMNSCLKELNASISSQSEIQSDYIQSRTRVDELKKNVSQVTNIQKMQEDLFESISADVAKLSHALPQIALRLNDLVINQNTKIELIISDFKNELDSTQDPEEVEKLELNIEIFKKLKLAQSKLPSNDPQALYDLMKKAFQGKGEEQVKALSSFDPLTRLILKTIFDNNLMSFGVVEPSELTRQMSLIKINMDEFVARQSGLLTLEEQKLSQFTSTLQVATIDRNNKENNCRAIEERSILLPQLIANANQTITGNRSLVDGCIKFCSKTWFPKTCYRL
jgi:hypothetical protein